MELSEQEKKEILKELNTCVLCGVKQPQRCVCASTECQTELEEIRKDET